MEETTDAEEGIVFVVGVDVDVKARVEDAEESSDVARRVITEGDGSSTSLMARRV